MSPSDKIDYREICNQYEEAGKMMAEGIKKAEEASRIDIIGQNGNDGTHYSDGSTADYYELPEGATELQDIISYKNMNAQIGEIFRACMRYGQVAHSPKLRDINKIIFYAQEEKKRLEKYGE